MQQLFNEIINFDRLLLSVSFKNWDSYLITNDKALEILSVSKYNVTFYEYINEYAFHIYGIYTSM